MIQYSLEIMKKQFLEVGEVVAIHGLRGDMRLYPWCDPGDIERSMRMYTDENGEVTAVHCTYDPESKGGNSPDGRKVRGTIHWVSAKSAIEADVRMYDRLFTEANMVTLPEGKEYNDYLNKDSVKEFKNAKLEAALADAGENERFQFVRTGYFIRDSKDANCWNSIVPLKESKTK